MIKVHSFAHRITVMALLASTMAAVTLMATFLLFDSINSRTQLQSRISTLADIVGQNSAAALDFEDRRAGEEVLHALQSESSVVSACLYDRSGRLFAQYRRDLHRPGCPHEVGNLPKQASNNATVTQSVMRHREFTGTLHLESDLQQLQARWRQLLRIAVLLLVLALAVGGFSGSILQRKISQPVRELSSAMQEVTTEQNFTVRVPLAGEGEIAQLGAGFNTMLAELEQRDREKKKVEAQLQHQALNDELTGLPNRRLLADRLGQALSTAQRENRKAALLYIDLDGFKLVNDSLGHSIGDVLLSKVATRLQQRVRTSDTLARLGGDEFSVVLSSIHSTEDAGIVAKGLLESLARPFEVEGHEITIGASIGVSCYPENGSNASDLLRQADSAMYAAKRAGKSRVMYYTKELGISVRERLSLENQLRSALARGEISIHYQPEYDTGTRRLIRFEALARWTHRTLGPVPPSKFIPIAEESGLIIPLGAYIMERACREAVRWQSLSAHPVQVAVNVSSIQFMRDSFVEEVAEVLRHTGLMPNLLQIELTESIMLSGADRVANTMHRLSDLGVSLAIDDFGTGYSCLGYLPKLPFDALKIDRSFVNELGVRPEVDAMVHSLVTLAHNLGMRVIVEGIETQQQLDMIAGLGSNEIQGFLLGKPTPNPAAHLEAHSTKRIVIPLPLPDPDPSRRD